MLRAFDLDPGLAIGLAIIAAVPGGTVSNVFTYAGKGDVPLSIALTAVTSLVCVVSVPVRAGAARRSYVPPTFSLPRVRIAAEIVATLLVPLGIGMAVLRRWPDRAERLSRLALVATTVLIAVIVVGSATAGRLDVDAMGFANLAVVAGFALLFAGSVSPRRSRPVDPGRSHGDHHRDDGAQHQPGPARAHVGVRQRCGER